jgi:NADP-dependent 3-hydroxy acid dehydrogenase YdfG
VAALTGRVIAITGASAGIGQATARHLLARGASVAAFARRADRLAALENEAAASGGQLLAVAGDVANEPDLRRLVDRTVERFGRIDVMVCNAGIGFHGTLDQTPPEAMRRLVDVNVLGTLYAARAALVAMRRQGSGHVIAVSSIVGRRGVSGSSVYGATKSAVVSFIESLRTEFVGTPFRASIVYPIATRTEFHDAIAREFGHRVTGHGPRQSVDDVAAAIVGCIERPRAEVYPYARAWWLALLAVVAPAQTDRLVRRFGRTQTKPPTDSDDHATS